MTRAELRSLLTQWIDDPAMGYFTEASLNVFLDNAHRECQKKLMQAFENRFVVCAETTTVADQADYVLPDNFVVMNSLVLYLGANNTNPRELIPIPMSERFKYSSESGTPEVFYLRNRRIVLVQKPDSAKTLEMLYTYVVSDFANDAATPDANIGEEYHEYIALIAARDCFLKDDRVPDNLERKLKYYEELMVQTAESRTLNRSRRIVRRNADIAKGF